jgi:PAS domain S-box-containing protein
MKSMEPTGPLLPGIFELIALTAADGIVIIDGNSKLLFVNPAAAKLFGYTPEELLGLSLSVVMPVEHREAHRNGVRNYILSGTRRLPWNSIRLPGLHRTGRIIPLEISFAEARNGDDVFFAGYLRDLSDRHWSQARLSVQYAVSNILNVADEDDYRSLESVLSAVGHHLGFALGNLWFVDQDRLRCHSTWHAASLPVGSFSMECSGRTFARGEGLPGRAWEINAAAWVESIPEDTNFPRAQAAAAAHLRSGFAFPLRCENQIIGVMEYFSTHVRPFEVTLVEIVTAIGQQISQFLARRRAQDTLRVTEAHHQLIFENANDAFAVSVDGYFRYVNKAYAVMFGYNDPQELIGVSLYDTLPASQHAVVRNHRQQRMAGLQELMRYEAWGLRKDRSEFPTEVRATDYWIKGEMYTLAILRDTTREREARVNLLQSNKALRLANDDLEQFAYAASHDLQEPLRMIALYSELLKRRHQEALAADGQQLLETITEAARRINDLVKDLLSYTKIESPDNSKSERTDPGAVLQDVKQALMQPIISVGAVVTHDNLPPLRVQRTHLYQLLQNLLSNSLKYHSAERPLRIHITRLPAKGGMVEFLVQDNGIGIAPAYHEKIFGIFKRLHSQQVPGTGIGLALCKRIVHFYRGTIWVDSTLGSGSTFHFTLPSDGIFD